jgi:hypothetical protein
MQCWIRSRCVSSLIGSTDLAFFLAIYRSANLPRPVMMRAAIEDYL